MCKETGSVLFQKKVNWICPILQKVCLLYDLVESKIKVLKRLRKTRMQMREIDDERRENTGNWKPKHWSRCLEKKCIKVKYSYHEKIMRIFNKRWKGNHWFVVFSHNRPAFGQTTIYIYYAD